LINPKIVKLQKKTRKIALLPIFVTIFVASFLLAQNLVGNYVVNAATGKPSKMFLKIEDLKINKGPTGAIDVTGKVRNNSTKNVQDIKLTASYYDDTNSLLGKTVKFLSNPSENVKPNGVKDFNFVETVTFARIAHSTVNATANEAK
jgi:uncharacterized membrane protein